MVYLPEHFAETDTAMMHRLIRSFPLGTLITLGTEGLVANHIPFVLDARASEYGRLLGHVARNNLVWCDHDPDEDALIVFQSIEAYITPNWYATKRETHEVVPTWNYAVVHACGTPRFIEDPAWLMAHLERLTNRHEAERPLPWKVSDAPADYVAGLMKGIVGFELPIARLSGKWKVSQNRSTADRNGVSAGLRAAADPASAAMADLVEGRQ